MGSKVRVSGGVLIASAAVLLSRSVCAQPVPAPPVDPARAAFEEGLQRLAERRYGDAADRLEDSLQQRPLPVTLYNLGLAYRGMRRYLLAIERFERYLAAPDLAAGPERLAAIRTELADLRAQLLVLDLSVTPAASAVFIDGSPIALGPQPLQLDPGHHVLDVRFEGHRPVHRELTYPPGAHERIEVALEPLRDGRLLVECASPQARIVVDQGAPYFGRAELGLPPGDHRVDVRLAAYQPYSRVVHIGYTGTVRIDVALAPIPQRSLWRSPGVIVAGSVVVSAAAALGLYFALRDVPEPHAGSWGTIEAPAR